MQTSMSLNVLMPPDDVQSRQASLVLYTLPKSEPGKSFLTLFPTVEVPQIFPVNSPMNKLFQDHLNPLWRC